MPREIKSCDNCGRYDDCEKSTANWPCHNESAWEPKPIEDKEPKLYTQEELDKAVKDEREACALECDERAAFAMNRIKDLQSTSYWTGRYKSAWYCAEAIRARNKQ